MKKFHPFSKCLEQAIADNSNPILGNTEAILKMTRIMAGMIEGQADGACRDFYNQLDLKFERLNRPTERIEYLEEQRRVLRKSEALSFFDAQLQFVDRELDRRERVASAIRLNLNPTAELLSVWEECGQKAAEFIQQIPFLKKMLEGLIEAENLELIEQELGLRKTHFTPEQVERLLEMQFSKEDISRMELLAYSFEDWVNERPGLYLKSDCFMPLEYMDGGVKTWKVHTLSSLEFQKIQTRKHEILEDFINAYTNALIGYFESRYDKSSEKKILVENELERVERLLFDPNSKEIYSTYGDLWLSFRNDYPRGNEKFCYWYKLICVDGQDPLSYIWPYHATITAKGLQDSDSTKFVVAALAFQRFKEFLKSRLGENILMSRLPKKLVREGLPGLEEIVKEQSKLPELFKRLSEIENAFINESGKIIGGRKARRHQEVMALAQTLNRWTKEGYGQFDVYSALCKHIELDESERPDKIPERSGYDHIRLTLFTQIKDLFK